MPLKKDVKNLITIAFIAVEAVIYVIFNVMAALDTPDPIYLKYAGVLLCLVTSVIFVFLPENGVDNIVVCVALLFTAISDLFILVLDDYYEVGLVTFIIAQSIYFYRLYAGRLKKIYISLGVRIAIMVALFITFAVLGMLNLLVAECIIYIAMLVANVADAFVICKKSVKNLLFALGLLLFFGCDICVGLHNFGSVLGVDLPHAVTAFVGVAIWAFYLPSQVLITCSAKRGGLNAGLCAKDEGERKEPCDGEKEEVEDESEG